MFLRMNRGVSYRLLVIFLFAFCILSLVPSSARSMRWYPSEANLVSVAIIGDMRGELSQHPENCRFCTENSKYRHIEASRGERYRIRLTNNTNERIGLVVSVDGRNIISGKKSYNRHHESMYVLRPWQTSDFSGWRSGMDREQRFYFTTREDSYSGRLGDISQLGFIKVAVFKEKGHYHSTPLVRRSEAKSLPGKVKSNSLHSKSMSMRESSPGTGYGEGTYSPAFKTDFRSEKFASQITTIKYEWPKVFIRPETKRHFKHKNHGFAAPPSGF